MLTSVFTTGTRRDPSLFECDVVAPPSTAPAALQAPQASQEVTVPIRPWQMPHATRASASIPSTTALGLQRFNAGHVDTYEPGTALERGYMRSHGAISSVFRDDTLDTTDTVVAALAEVDPSELVSPVPDLVPDPNDPDDPFWEQESEDDVVATPGREDYNTGTGGVTKRKLDEALEEALEVEGFADIDSFDVCDDSGDLPGLRPKTPESQQHSTITIFSSPLAVRPATATASPATASRDVFTQAAEAEP